MPTDRMSARPTRLALAALALAALLLPSCTYFSGRSTVHISSTPAGAYIFLDGVDTGETTPAMLDLGTFGNGAGMLASDRVVTIRKKGFEPESRTLHHHTTVYTSEWVDGATTWWFGIAPLFWTLGDFFLPFGVNWDYVPHDLHVKLYPEGEAPGKRP